MSSFNLGPMTLKSIFKKKETCKYPFQKKEAPAGLKGYVKNNLEACNLCTLCQKRCPVGAIIVARKDRKWVINHYQCIQCGYCISECKQDALEMVPKHPESVTKIVAEEFEIPEDKK